MYPLVIQQQRQAFAYHFPVKENERIESDASDMKFICYDDEHPVSLQSFLKHPAITNPPMNLVFATNNPNKLREVSKLIPPGITLQSLKDIGCFDELPETGRTLVENARQKARYVHDKFGVNCFSDDSGLEVEALGGRPGVDSAIFAGNGATADDNIGKLLAEMKGISRREAVFRTVMVLYLGGEESIFDGSIPGTITEKKNGTGGFGYDPVFVPDGCDRTFSEMTPEEKNAISHRSIALNKLVEFLKQQVSK
jgi:XTP/dITP diphosphohydrolase